MRKKKWIERQEEQSGKERRVREGFEKVKKRVDSIKEVGQEVRRDFESDRRVGCKWEYKCVENTREIRRRWPVVVIDISESVEGGHYTGVEANYILRRPEKGREVKRGEERIGQGKELWKREERSGEANIGLSNKK
jgi:hypothetical protein